MDKYNCGCYDLWNNCYRLRIVLKIFLSIEKFYDIVIWFKVLIVLLKKIISFIGKEK